MPWRCPACHLQIHHSEAEPAPRPGVVYRCHVCRIELMLDIDSKVLTLAPFRPSEPNDER